MLTTKPAFRYSVIELELLADYHAADAGHGQLIEEAAMLQRDLRHRKRQWTCICKSDLALVMSLNHAVFDVLGAEHVKKTRELLAQFIYRTLPAVSTNYTFNKILSSVGQIWESKQISKGETLLLEGGETDRLYVIQEGRVALSKRIARLKFCERNCFSEHQVLELGPGDLFGEDKLFFKSPNQFTARVSSVRATIISIKSSDFAHSLKRTWSDLEQQLKCRRSLAAQVLERIRSNFQTKPRTNFEYHVMSSLPKYEEIDWEARPLKPAEALAPVDPYLLEARTKPLRPSREDDSHYLHPRIVHPEHKQSKTQILSLLLAREDLNDEYLGHEQEVRKTEKEKQIHHYARNLNSVKFRRHNAGNDDVEKQIILSSVPLPLSEITQEREARYADQKRTARQVSANESARRTLGSRGDLVSAYFIRPVELGKSQPYLPQCSSRRQNLVARSSVAMSAPRKSTTEWSKKKSPDAAGRQHTGQRNTEPSEGSMEAESNEGHSAVKRLLHKRRTQGGCRNRMVVMKNRAR